MKKIWLCLWILSYIWIFKVNGQNWAPEDNNQKPLLVQKNIPDLKADLQLRWSQKAKNIVIKQSNTMLSYQNVEEKKSSRCWTCYGGIAGFVVLGVLSMTEPLDPDSLENSRLRTTLKWGAAGAIVGGGLGLMIDIGEELSR